MEIVEESSWCNDVLYYKSLLFLECIQLMGRPKKNCIQFIGTEGVLVFIRALSPHTSYAYEREGWQTGARSLEHYSATL